MFSFLQPGLDRKKYPPACDYHTFNFKFNILGVRLSHAIHVLGVQWGAMLKIETTIASGQHQDKKVGILFFR